MGLQRVRHDLVTKEQQNHPHRFPWWLSSKESACQFRRLRFNPWVRKVPWRRKWQPTPVFLPGKCHRERSLEGYSSCSHKRVRHELVTRTTIIST